MEVEVEVEIEEEKEEVEMVEENEKKKKAHMKKEKGYYDSGNVSGTVGGGGSHEPRYESRL